MLTAEEEVRFLALVADQLALAIDAAVNFYLSQQGGGAAKADPMT